MPLFTRELNALADSIGVAALTVRLHTALPTDAAPTNGRIAKGGGLYESGIAVPATDISDAANGDIQITAALAFGAADEAVGTLTHWSAYRSNLAVAFGTLPSTIIANGDTFTVDANAIQFNLSTT